MRTPGASSGTLKCSTSAFSPGSPSTALVATTAALGDWLQNILRPLTRNVAPSAIAVVAGQSQSEPPLVAMTMPSLAMRRSTPSASGAPARRR